MFQIQAAPVPEDHAPLSLGETPASRFAVHPLGESGRFRVGIAGGRTLDGGGVGNRVGVVEGTARLVALWGGRPDRHQFDLAGL